MLVQSADTVERVYDGWLSMLGFSFPIDINECTRNTGMCEDTCENTEGSYICVCNNGRALAADGHNCTGQWAQWYILVVKANIWYTLYKLTLGLRTSPIPMWCLIPLIIVSCQNIASGCTFCENVVTSMEMVAWYPYCKYRDKSWLVWRNKLYFCHTSTRGLTPIKVKWINVIYSHSTLLNV